MNCLVFAFFFAHFKSFICSIPKHYFVYANQFFFSFVDFVCTSQQNANEINSINNANHVDFIATLDKLETKFSIQDDNDSVSTDTISENIDMKSESSSNSVDTKTKFVGQNGECMRACLCVSVFFLIDLIFIVKHFANQDKIT